MVLDLARRQSELAPAEARDVRIRGMCSDGDTALARDLDCPFHRRRVAGVEAARDVGGRHYSKQLLIRGPARAAESFAEVGVEIDGDEQSAGRLSAACRR